MLTGTVLSMDNIIDSCIVERAKWNWQILEIFGKYYGIIKNIISKCHFPNNITIFFYKNRKINLARNTQEKGDIVEYKVSRYYN